MDKIELIKSCLGGEKDVNAYVDNHLSDFNKYFIHNKNSNIKKGKLIGCFKKELRLLHEDKSNETYLFLRKKTEVLDKNFMDVKCVDKANHFIFKIKGDELFLYGNFKLFNKSFRRYKKEFLKNTALKILEKDEGGVKESFNEKEFIKTLFNLNKDKDISVYEILFNSLDILNKRIRCQFSSELKKEDVLELLSKEELKDIFLKNINLGLINSICFRDKEDNQETLKIREEGNGKLYLQWKRKVFSSFKKKLSGILEINENETVIYNYPTTLDNLIREPELNWYHQKIKYKTLLTEYAKYLSINDGHVQINSLKIIKDLKELLKKNFKIEEVNYIRKNKLIFPSLKSKKNKIKELFRIRDKTGKIVNYLYVNEKKLYEDKNNFLKEFFVFMPCLVLDLRQRGEGDYYISCSELIENLHHQNEDYFKKLFDKNKKDIFENIESKSFQELFDITSKEILPQFDLYNKNLSPQRKGEIYEKIIFILFSILFKMHRLGGPNRHDGNLFIEKDFFVGYDSKNLEKNGLDNFTNKKTKKFKDIDYIEKNQIKHYFFIFKNIDETFFNSLTLKIRETLQVEVFIKAFDISFVEKLFNQINSEGLSNYSRENKQKLVKDLLIEQDKIIK
ncbi:MAG: hypothetical protein WC511_00885 [Candidatus Pacearchaeota archaeon]|jgi:hypothetical protein